MKKTSIYLEKEKLAGYFKASGIKWTQYSTAGAAGAKTMTMAE